MNLKQFVANEIASVKLPYDLQAEALNALLTETGEAKNGEVTLPCFSLSKTLRKSPMEIANELASVLQNELKNHAKFDQVVAVNGYVNFFFNKEQLAGAVLEEVLAQKEQYGSQNIGNGETLFIDFSSPNLAKYMHIGHLKTTMLGWSIYKLFSFMGYKVVRINYVGDYGTPFGKMLAAYKHWGKKEDIDARGVDAIQDLYVKFTQEAANNEALMDEAREWFKRIETKEPEATKLFEWFLEVGVQEVKRICNILGVSFDSWRGENYYSDKMDPVIKDLEQKGLLIESEGAKIVDLSAFNLGVSLIQKSDGASLYATRDLTAVQDRYENYHFDRGFYVTSNAQILHFKQWFKIVELLDRPYANKLEHIYYGTYSLPNGKIGSRYGKQAIIRDLLNLSKDRAMEILISRGTKHDDMDEVAQKIAVGSLAFEAVKTERAKDSVFDPENSINFEGETSPYMQYTYARCCSILNKVEQSNLKTTQLETINDDYFALVKLLNKFPNTLQDCVTQRETYMLCRLMLNISSEFNKFYGFNRIIDNETVNITNLKLVQAVKMVLANGLTLLGIPLIEKM